MAIIQHRTKNPSTAQSASRIYRKKQRKYSARGKFDRENPAGILQGGANRQLGGVFGAESSPTYVRTVERGLLFIGRG